MSAVLEKFEQERRLQRRFEVLQPAKLIISAEQELACDIRDFCLGGLQLKFDPTQGDTAVIHTLPSDAVVEVRFTPPVSVADQTFNIKARLARRTTDGVGVAFLGSPIDATRALNKVAAAMRTQRIVSKRYQGMDGKALQDTCKTLLMQSVEDAAREFYGLIENRLSVVSQQSTNFAERNEMVAAYDPIRLHEANVYAILQKQLQAAIEQIYLPAKQTEVPRAEADKPGLALVQTDDFEDWLNLTAEINKLENRFSIELAAHTPRLEKLYGRALDRTTNPFAPAVIEQAMKTAFDGLTLALKVRQVIYSTMREALVHPLGELYKQLDSILPAADEGVSGAEAQGWPGIPEGGMADALESGEIDASHKPTEASSRAMAASRAGGVAGALMNLFRRAQQSPVSSPDGATPAAAMEAPLAAALGRNPMEAGGFVQRFASTSRRVLNELSVAGRIQPGQEAMAEGSAAVFGALAERIETEKSLSTVVKHYVKQLEEPLLKLAVVDTNFLNAPQHPARQVLNAVDRLAMVSSDDGKINDQKLLQVIQRWTERIKGEADKNPAVYDEARAQLEKVLLPLLRMRSIRIARLQAGLEGWQKMGQANRMISRELEQRMAGREVPEAVIGFFNPAWRNYLIRVMLRNGVGSPEEAEAWQAVDRLIEWMDPGLVERPALNDVQRLLTYIDSKLSLVSAGKEVQEALLERLADGLFETDKTRLKRIAAPQGAMSAAPTEPPISEQDAALLAQYRVGDWLSFSQSAAPLNLVWIGDDPHIYVFSNYKGLRKIELKRHEFLELLKTGESGVTDNLELPLMDRSLSSMIEHMHRNLVKQATHDTETSLIRRSEFMRRIKQTWLQMDATDRGCVLGVIDIEDLRIAQTRVSPAGYLKMLHALAQHIEQKCSCGGFAARTGERTFAFIRTCESQEAAQEKAETLITHINQFNFEWEGERFTVSANAGLAWASDFVEPEAFYNRADTACLSAKHEGRNQFAFYSEADAARKGSVGLEYWAARFNSILASEQLYLRCQPIVPLGAETGQASHYEILLGANTDSADDESINIGDFVAAIERLKRISELDQWVVKEVFGWIRNHPREFEQVGAFSINLSGPSVNSKSFLSFMEEELGRGDIPANKLIFEITESAAIDSFANADQFIRKFRRYGCRFSLDDFGVGFSSFSYLKNLKVDYLKIDGSFIRDMTRNEVDAALVSSMQETSRFLGIKTIAECVENEETLQQLKTIGVNYVQGWHTGKPVPIAELVARGSLAA